jgi:glutathione peroxidase
MWMGRFGGRNNMKEAKETRNGNASFYDLEVRLNNNSVLDLSELKGRKVVIVNTASECGFTGQYAQLQELHEFDKDLFILGVPSNEFGGQEPGSDDEIRDFCKVNYGVSFPLAKKSTVLKKTGKQSDLYKWLTTKDLNGWNDTEPEWNFVKYVINEEGQLTHYFGPAVSPFSEEFQNAIKSV